MRLLSQFDDIESEATKASDEWLERNSHHFDRVWHDEGDFYESANNAGIEFYQLLSDMRDSTRLSVVAGMYHEWEKQLHQWMVDQMRGWCPRDSLEKIVWKINLTQLDDLTKQLGWPICEQPYFSQLDACRLVVNVYKHGNGDSLQDLKKKHPEYLRNPIGGSLTEPFFDFLDHTHLQVNDEHLQYFSDAIVRFWQDIPKDIYDQENSKVPEWLEKVFNGTDKRRSKKQGGSET